MNLNNLNIIDLVHAVEDIQNNIEVLITVLHTAIEKMNFSEATMPTVHALDLRAISDNAPQAYRNTFDYIVSYRAISCLLEVIDRYAWDALDTAKEALHSKNAA